MTWYNGYMKGIKTKNWNVEDIRQGIMYFHNLYSRVPRKRDFEEFEFLPDEGYVNRVFGGMSELWKELGYKAEYRDV